jgi:hypothetical protein
MSIFLSPVPALSDPAPAYRYHVFGLVIESVLPLPSLGRPVAAASGGVDVSVALAPVDPVPRARPDLRRAQIAGLFRYQARAGRFVDLDVIAGADPRDVADLFLGRVLTVIMYQRGLLPLHAGAVRGRHGALVICGPSGVGKSTLTAALAARGYPLAADDMVPIDLTPDGAALSHGGCRRLKLDAAALAGLGLGNRWPVGGQYR